MNFTISRQNHIQKKISKNLEKEAKIAEIKKVLDSDFQKYLKELEGKTEEKVDHRKLKVELNQIVFLNMCKEKKLNEMKSKIAVLNSHRRSNSVQTMHFDLPLEKIKELGQEIQAAVSNIEAETKETELLEQIKIREKTMIRYLSERISKLQDNESDLVKFSEKLTRTSVLAESLYETSSKSLQTSKKELFSQHSKRKKTLTKLRKSEIKLLNQVEKMKSKLTDKIFEDHEKQARFQLLSSKLESLVLNSRDTEQESSSNVRTINSINFMQEKISKLIRKSQFINESVSKVPLSELGEYLNKLIFAETQLQLRCSELINTQGLYRSKVQSLEGEMREIREKFSDSQFIQNWTHRFQSRNLESLKFEESVETNERKIENSEKLCLKLMQSLCNMQDHVNKIVKKVNLLSIETQDKLSKSGQLLRKRTLSTRSSFSILPVIKESTNLFSPFEFESMVGALVVEKFRSTSRELLKRLSRFYMLKNFLGASEIIEFLSSCDSLQQAESKFYELFVPAHENLRSRVTNICKFAVSFINGINLMSKQVMNSFDKIVLTESQMNKYISLFPGLRTPEKNLKKLVEIVVKMQIKTVDMENIRKIAKKQASELLRRNSIFQHSESPAHEAAKNTNERNHKRTTSQKEIKDHLDELNVKLVKSRRHQ